MLSRQYRFHGHNALRSLYQKGKSTYSPSFKLLWLAADADKVRAAVVVSKKVHKSAVVRNRIRRRVYTQIRLMEVLKNHPVELAIVVQNPAPVDMSDEKLRSELSALFSKIRT